LTTLEKRPLGLTGLTVSCIGLGTVKIGRNQGVKYPAGFTLPDDVSVSALLTEAGQLGINLIDTAPAYGNSEQRLGKLLTDRDNWILCSKVGEEFQNGLSAFDFSPQHVRFSVERSLRRLATDYLDIVLVHSDGNDLEIIENSGCLETLSRLKESGSIRSFGMSTKTVEGGLAATMLCDVVMVTLNLQSQDDRPVIEQAARLNRGVLIKKGLLSGHLGRSVNEEKDLVRKSFELIFEEPGVSSVIVGTIDRQHLRNNVRTAIDVLSDSG